jgi:hypothetical protein
MALLMCKMGKFMKKKGYGERKRRDHNKEYVRRCYKCKSPDHIVADSPYNSDNDKDEKKKHKKEKKEEKEKKMTFTKKKKGSGYVVTWDSDGTSVYDDGSSNDDKKYIKKALASITINNKPSIFDTPSTCLMAKPTKVKYDVSDDDDCESGDCRSDDEKEEYIKEELLDMSEQVYTCIEMKRKEYKELRKEIQSVEQSFDEFNTSHESLGKTMRSLAKLTLT